MTVDGAAISADSLAERHDGLLTHSNCDKVDAASGTGLGCMEKPAILDTKIQHCSEFQQLC